MSAVHAAGSAASTKVSCAGAGNCTVTETVTVEESVKVGRKTKRKTVVVGSRTVTVTGGRSQTVNITLNRAGAALLRAHRRLSAKLTAKQGQRTLRSQNLAFAKAKNKKKK